MHCVPPLRVRCAFERGPGEIWARAPVGRIRTPPRTSTMPMSQRTGRGRNLALRRVPSERQTSTSSPRRTAVCASIAISVNQSKLAYAIFHKPNSLSVVPFQHSCPLGQVRYGYWYCSCNTYRPGHDTAGVANCWRDYWTGRRQIRSIHRESGTWIHCLLLQSQLDEEQISAQGQSKDSHQNSDEIDQEACRLELSAFQLEARLAIAN